jgi:delta-1-pyrroline-5-carboxylate synthetase
MKNQELAPVLLSRLSLNEKKLITLSDGMNQIAENTNILGKLVKSTRLAESLMLQQITVPIGVLLVIFESRPDSLPQIASLCISSGNGLLLKGGSEAFNTNVVLHKFVQDSLSKYVSRDTISLLHTREEINDILQLDSKYIDLIIPRGSNQLVSTIQKNSKSIPVLGHAEGICHVYLDKEADPQLALKVIRDAKCDYPSACNAMETLLIHKDLLNTDLFNSIVDMLESEKVKIYSGPNLNRSVKFAPPLAQDLHHEYSDLGLTIELVDDVNSAINHINRYGSYHTDSILTTNSSFFH